MKLFDKPLLIPLPDFGAIANTGGESMKITTRDATTHLFGRLDAGEEGSVGTQCTLAHPTIT